jgi:hypothetical protein
LGKIIEINLTGISTNEKVLSFLLTNRNKMEELCKLQRSEGGFLENETPAFSALATSEKVLF